MRKMAIAAIFLVAFPILAGIYVARADLLEWKRLALEIPQPVPVLDSKEDIRKVFANPLICSACHSRHYEEWSNSFHAKSVNNAGFQALYLKYLDDLKKEETKQALGREAGPQELRQCLFCHAPMVQFASDRLVQQISDAIAQGRWGEIQDVQISCVTCHTITPEGNWAGPFSVTGTMHGPIEDPAPSTISGHQSKFSPLHKESKFCATCHSKEPFNVYCSLVYDQSQGVREPKQCQECHMEAQGQRAVALGGKERTAHSHLFPGGRFKEAWPNALDLSLDVEKSSPKELRVQVTIKSKIPHNIPDG
jgi:hypothetical protein